MALFVSAFGTAAVLRAPAAAAETKTGVGLSEHVLKAYREGWKYRAGCYGQLVNGVHSSDCSGLIKSYLWWTGDKTNPNPALCSVAGSSGAMLASASEQGNITNAASLPKIHGLILYNPGHVGVYVGNNREVDNRDTGYDVKNQPVVGGTYHWKKWFKLPQLQYPQTGFATLEGKKYYYEKGQYVTDTSRTVDGVSYTFNSSGEMVSGSPTDEAEACASLAKAAANVGPGPSIGRDAKGESVRSLQQKLSDLGYYHEPIHDSYDAFVEDAVRAFQKASGLAVTGTADEKTQAVLYSFSAKMCPGVSLEPGLHSSLVASMQKRLIALGYMSGEATAYYGDTTKAAVLLFQKLNGMSQTAVMDDKALAVLNSDQAMHVQLPLKTGL